MKPYQLLSAAILLAILSSCEQTPLKSESRKKMEVDSFSQAKYGESSDEHIKKMVDADLAKAMLDTVGLYKAPVKVLSAKVVKEEYSSYRNVYLRYKNVSGKSIAAIRFRWYGINAFGEPADLGNSYATGFGGGFTDDALKPGRSDDGTWSILSRDAKKIKLAWVALLAVNPEM